MKTKNTILLLLVTIALGGGLYYVANVKKVPKTEELMARAARLFDFNASDISQFEIKGPDRHFQFEKRESKWFLKLPLQVRAAETEVNAILAKVQYLEFKRSLTEKEVVDLNRTLADYGLEKPKTSLILKVMGRDVVIHFGNEPRQGNDQYLRVEGNSNIYRVDKMLGAQLNKKLEEYRERLLFDMASREIQSFEIKNGTKSVELIKTNDQWRIVQPLIARADARRVTDFLNQTCGIRAEDFLSEDVAVTKQYGVDEPFMRGVRLVGAKSISSSLIFGDPLKTDPMKIAARIKGQNSIVSIQASYTNQFLQTVNDFRDRKLASFQPAQVDEIELRVREMTTLLQKKEGVWSFVPAQPFEPDQDLVHSFLDRLAALEVKEFITDVATDLDRYGLKTPLSGLRLRGKVEGSGASNAVSSVLLNLHFGSLDPVKKLAPLKLEDESSVYAISSDDRTRLPNSALDLRSRLLFKLQKEGIKSCTQKKGKSSVVIQRNAEGSWKLSEGTQGVLNNTPWAKFINHAEHFSVERIVGTALNPTLKQYGLENPILSFQIESEEAGKKVIHEFLVGRETSAKEYFILWKNELLVCQIIAEDHQTLIADWTTKVVPAPGKAPLN